MQKECVNLILTMAREFENVSGQFNLLVPITYMFDTSQMKQLAAKSEKKKAEHYKTLGVSQKVSDLGDSTKFGIADAKEFGRLVQSLNKEVAGLKELRTAHLKTIRELEAAMLKGACNVRF